MERVVIKVYRHEARSAKEFLHAILSASKIAGIHRIVNPTNRVVDVYFIPGRNAVNVDVHRVTEAVSGSIQSTANMVLDARDADSISYEYEKYELSRVYIRFTISSRDELVIWNWYEAKIKPLMFVFGGKHAYERAVEFADFIYLGNVVIKE